MKKAIFVSIIFCLFLASSLFAVPQYFTYQGVLRDSGGNLVTGTRSMTFNIYDAASAGTLKYGPQTETAVAVNGGAYSVQLGPITPSMFDGGDRYLEVAVAGTILTPRLKINSVAYAIRSDSATDATTLNGRTSALTGNNIIPYTNGSGLLDSSVVPATGVATLASFATNAGNSDKLDGFHAGINGAGIVPTTDASGKLAPATIPAVDAASVDGIHANTTATGGQLYPLDSSGRLSGIPVTAEASGNAGALNIKGKLYASGAVVGTGTILATNNNVLVPNNFLTSQSLIFITPTVSPQGITIEALTIQSVEPASNRFTVGFTRATTTYSSFVVPFNYLIIN